MWHDPIVEETRQNGEELAKQVGYDKTRYIEMLRRNQRKSGHTIKSFSIKKATSAK